MTKGKKENTQKQKKRKSTVDEIRFAQAFNCSVMPIYYYIVCVHVDKNRTEISGQKKRKSVSIAEQCQPMKGVLANFLAKDSLLFSLSNEKNKNSIKTGL